DHSEVAKVIAGIKCQAHKTRDTPSQIIQDNIATIPLNLSLYMPTHEALHIRIKQIRSAEVLPQPQTLEEIDVLVLLCLTLNGDL
ncbi:21309_t:CDS:1, partial [Dentiscutata erythropus]